MTLTEPGVYLDINFEDYCQIPAMNNSTLKAAVRKRRQISMAHLFTAMNQPDRKDTASLSLGRLVHTGKLETLNLLDRYVVMPPFETDEGNKTKSGKPTDSKATTYYKEKAEEFRRVNINREVVSRDDLATMQRMLAALQANPRAVEYLDAPGPAEVTLIWDDPDYGVRMKCRLDKMDEANRRAPDLKTSQDPMDFEWSIMKFCYDMQAAIYTDGLRACKGGDWEWPMVVVGSEDPHLVLAAPLNAESIEVGRKLYKAILSRYVQCRDTGIWPGPPNPEEWSLPSRVFCEEEAEVKVRISAKG